MDRDEILPAIAAERRGVADLLDGLTREEWESDSLCAGWTVRDVAAHLALTTRLTALGAIAGMVRARFDIDRMIGDAARRYAAEFEPEELVAQLRETADSPRRPLGTQERDPLVDILVHGQDIARPLGRRHGIPVDRAVPALEHVWSSSFYGARKRFGGLRFVATDSDWSAGDGEHEVRGPSGQLLVLSTGRPAGLDGVGGSGAEEAASRVRA